MRSVSSTTGAVWYHTWHAVASIPAARARATTAGTFIAVED